MIAKYEQSVLLGEVKVSVRSYGGLQNLPHWHMECELIYAERGSAEIMSENTVYNLNEGKCIFIKSGAVHYIKADENSVISVMKLVPELIYSAFGNKEPICPLIDGNYPIKSVFDKIRQELTENERYYDIICSSLAEYLIAEIFRGEKTEQAADKYDNTSYKRLLRLIDERYSDITFDEAADFMCFCKPYFSKFFKKMSGMTFSEYLNIVRVSESVKLLSEKKLSAGEISAAVGFGTIRSFNRIFKKYTGFSPRELPEEFIFIGGKMHSDIVGFDPTLPVSKIL